MGFWAGLVLFCMGAAMGFGSEGLWLIEQDFVKFGKREAYEGYKKVFLEGFWAYAKREPSCTFAERGIDSPLYIYMTPVKDYEGFGDLMGKRAGYEGSLSADALLPLLSTINFTIESLHRYLPGCSFLPKGKESISAYGAIHFYVFGVMPPNGRDFEEHVGKIAREQALSASPVCFRTWKVVMGGDLPKYLLVVFAATEKEAEKLASGLEFGAGPIKNILRSQKEGSCELRPDLSSKRKVAGDVKVGPVVALGVVAK